MVEVELTKRERTEVILSEIDYHLFKDKDARMIGVSRGKQYEGMRRSGQTENVVQLVPVVGVRIMPRPDCLNFDPNLIGDFIDRLSENAPPRSTLSISEAKRYYEESERLAWQTWWKERSYGTKPLPLFPKLEPGPATAFLADVRRALVSKISL